MFENGAENSKNPVTTTPSEIAKQQTIPEKINTVHNSIQHQHTTTPMLSFASPPVMDYSRLHEQQQSLQKFVHMQQLQQQQTQQPQTTHPIQGAHQHFISNSQVPTGATYDVSQQQITNATAGAPGTIPSAVSKPATSQTPTLTPTQAPPTMGMGMMPTVGSMPHMEPFYGYSQPTMPGMPMPMYPMLSAGGVPNLMQQQQFQQWQHMQHMQHMKNLAAVPPHGYDTSSLGFKRTVGDVGVVQKPLKPKMRKKKICKHPTCSTFAKGGGFCIRHGGGKRCAVSGCARLARFAGSLCYSHGITKKKYNALNNSSTDSANTTTSPTTPTVTSTTTNDEHKENTTETATASKEKKETVDETCATNNQAEKKEEAKPEETKVVKQDTSSEETNSGST